MPSRSSKGSCLFLFVAILLIASLAANGAQYYAYANVDLDNDGIISSLDLCPNTPDDEYVNERGCMFDELWVGCRENVTDVTEDDHMNGYIIFENCPRAGTPGMYIRCRREHVENDAYDLSSCREVESSSLDY